MKASEHYDFGALQRVDQSDPNGLSIGCQLLPMTAFLIMIMLTACDDGRSPHAINDLMEIEPYVDEGVETEIVEVDWSKCAHWVHDPSGNQLSTYPDDTFTIDDENSKTGLSLDLADRPWTEASSNFVKRLTKDISVLDGWGINAGIVLQFEDLDLSSLIPAIESGKAMLYLEDPSLEELPYYPAQVPVEARMFNQNKSLILEPLRPLKPATRYGLVFRVIPPMSDQVVCVAPSPIAQALLEESSVLAERRRSLLERLQIKVSEVAAISVFTTQSAPDVSVEIANQIRSQNYSWNDDLDCSQDGAYHHCTRSFNALRFQDDEGVVRDREPKSEYAIKVHMWRPRNRADETAALLFGHGIGGDVDNVYILDRITEQLPITKIAIDAVSHGEHPTATATSSFQRVINFFALDIATQTLQALRARDNFRQSTYDKLQLVELLHQDPDINQDGRADLDLDKLGYYGLSLGGIMGVELLSLEPRFTLAILAVPGARLVSVLTDGSVIGDFKSAIYALVGGKEIFDGLTPLAQVLLDAADPGTYAPYVLGAPLSRLEASRERPLHLLMQMAMNDEVVPNSANAALARALALPHLTPVAAEIPLLERVEGPLTRNLGESTSALMQFDRVTTGPLELTLSSHMNIPDGREGRYQSRLFLSSWLNSDAEAPLIINPYEYYNIPPLP